MSENEKLKITDLNSDCLSEIFKYLNHNDLVNLKGAHSAFNSATDHVASITKYEFVIKDRHKSRKVSNVIRSIDTFLQYFGDKIQHFHIKCYQGTSHEQCNSILYLHIETMLKFYCGNGNVKHLSITGFELREDFVRQNLRLFTSLEFLNAAIDEDKLDWFVEFFKTTGLNDSIGSTFDTEVNIFEKLVSTLFENLSMQFSHVTDEDLVPENLGSARNHTLKHLELHGNPYHTTVLAHFPNIETLAYHHLEEDHELLSILELPKLKTFELTYGFLEFSNVEPFLIKVARQNKLNSLTLNSERLSDTEPNEYEKHEEEKRLVQILCKMTNLTELKLNHHLERMGSSLKNLRTFYCDPANDYVDSRFVLEFAKKAKQLIFLDVGCKFNKNKGKDIQMFYDNLVKIRQSQDATKVLYFANLRSTAELVQTDEQSKYVKVIEDN